MNEAALSMHENDNEWDNVVGEEMALFQKHFCWLKKHMPAAFFQELDQKTVALIARHLMGFHLQDYFSPIYFTEMSLTLCLDSSDADVRILKNYSTFGIKHYHCYVSDAPLPDLPIGEEKKLRVALIRFTQVVPKITSSSLSKQEMEMLWDLVRLFDLDISEDAFQMIIRDITTHFLHSISHKSLESALHMFFRAKTRNTCQYEVQYHDDWKEKNTPSLEIVLAWKNVSKHHFLYRLAQLVHRHGLTMQRVNATYINPYERHNTLILVIGLHGSQGKAAWQAADIEDFLRELVTTKYFPYDDLIHQRLVQTRLITGNLGHFLRTLIPFIHQSLVDINEDFYDYKNIQEAICRHPEITIILCEAFEYKFHPKKHDLKKYEEKKALFEQLTQKLDTGNEINDERRRNVFIQGMNLVSHTLKTNFYRSNKAAMSFRLDPHYLNHIPLDRKTLFPELPYGIIFIRGLSFFGFHIRFKDLARGGVRTVFPDDLEKVHSERNHVFKECYHLAYTQHKKNKDIPEGGSKGVIFLEPYDKWKEEQEILRNEFTTAEMESKEIKRKLKQFQKRQREELLHYAQKAFVTSIITIVNTTEEGNIRAKDVIDYLQKPEDLYLGPDEKMTAEMIQWIAQHSKRKKYRPGESFISSKPCGGINHKKYGVTSLGVHVYVEEILRYLQINPATDPFTVKMSGGPDGDVAGNQILNFYRHYPETTKLLALVDISGTIYDPEGLDLCELASLFQEGKAIRHYPVEKLTNGGLLLDTTAKRKESTYCKQTLCWRKKEGKISEDWLSGSDMNYLLRTNVHQTKSDLFIPAGGRPRTLNSHNYTDFLDEAGQPTAKAIIEGANLYLTEKARRKLEELNVLIVKDSSANKAGVTASSFEVLCGLTLSPREFTLEQEELVDDILSLLRMKSLHEARLLLEHHRKTGEKLTVISDLLSQRINDFTDQLMEYLEKIPLSQDKHSSLLHCFFQSVPPLLKEKYRSQLLSRISDHHKKAMIASCIASRLVYEKGLHWSPSLIDILPVILHSDYFRTCFDN